MSVLVNLICEKETSASDTIRVCCAFLGNVWWQFCDMLAADVQRPPEHVTRLFKWSRPHQDLSFRDFSLFKPHSLHVPLCRGYTPGRGRGLSELSERVGVSGQCGVNSSVCACRRLFNSSTCRISADSSVRESTLIGCSGKQTSARKKTQKQRGNAPWVCGCGFHGYTHLAQLFLIFLPCLFTWASVTFYQTCSSVQSSSISESGFKRQQFVFLWRGICLWAVAARTRLLVASCRLRRVNRATFWPDSDGENTTQQPIFVTAQCLLSVWCVGALKAHTHCSADGAFSLSSCDPKLKLLTI